MGNQKQFRLFNVIRILLIVGVCYPYLCDTGWSRQTAQRTGLANGPHEVRRRDHGAATGTCQQALIQPCGAVTCNISVEYCDDGECFQCDDSCSKARIDDDISGNKDCYRICPVYMERDTCYVPFSPKECGLDSRFIGAVVFLVIVIVVLAAALVIALLKMRVMAKRMNKLLNTQESQPAQEPECVNGIIPSNLGAPDHDDGSIVPEISDANRPDMGASEAAALISADTASSHHVLEPGTDQTAPKQYVADDGVALQSVASSSPQLSLSENETMTSPEQPDSTELSSSIDGRHLDMLMRQL